MTIKDLAAKTGYAVGTVSRALNNHPNVSERARQEILEAAAESGFQLNVNAKQLKQHHSTTILVVVKGIGNELFGEMVESMAKAPILLAMANPVPEIMPDIALAHGAAVVGTGRSDFPNQINNVLVFPGLFKGALSCGAVQITEGMKHAAARALADLVPPEQLSPTCILPSPLNRAAAEAVAHAVAEEARRTGHARF